MCSSVHTNHFHGEPMNRRTFNKLASFGALNALIDKEKLHASPTASPISLAQAPSPATEWPAQVYRRLLIDTHIPDWDPAFLSRLDPVGYVDCIARADFQSLMQYTNSCVGLCLWKTKVGQMHANLKGRDLFGEIISESRRRGLHTVAYFIVIWDNWAFENHPAWRVEPSGGDERILQSRYGLACPNTPYRDYTFACLQEIVANYPIEGVFIDMTFWPTVCYCPGCTARYRKEFDKELPRLVDWNDPEWRNFQKARQRWMLEYAQELTSTIKKIRPITVNHQFSLIFHDWLAGQPLEITNACDYLGGDFYGGPTQYSMVCKAYTGLTRNHPFEYHTTCTSDLHDHVTIKPIERLRVETCVATLHSAAQLIIDGINPDGTLNHDVFELLGRLNRERAAYEPFLGGELQADVAIYYDKESMYNPSLGGPVSAEDRQVADCPHLNALMGAGTILREAHIPFSLVTNANLSQLSNYRAVIVPNVLEMTAEQADQFARFVRDGGVLYASGPSSLDRFDKKGPRYLLEEVLGVRYQGALGTKITYLTPKDEQLRKVIWPQHEVTQWGPMIHAEAVSGAEVLATVTLPWVSPELGHSIGSHFSSIHSNPPNPTPGTHPAAVLNSYGKGKALWVAAPIESSSNAVSAQVVLSLLKRILPGPYKFEVDTHPSIEMTLFRQPDKKRLLAGLLNMQEQLPLIAMPATVRVQLPPGHSLSAVTLLPDRKPIPAKLAGPYVEFRLEPFEALAMAIIEYR